MQLEDDRGKDLREEEFKTSIKSIERQKLWVPLVIFGPLIFFIWMAGGDLFARPSLDAAYPMAILIVLLGVMIEILNLKILIIKAEYRDWLRDFRNEKWKHLNND